MALDRWPRLGTRYGESWSTWTRTRTNRTKICCAANYTIDHWIGRAVTPVRVGGEGRRRCLLRTPHTLFRRGGFGEHADTGRGTGLTPAWRTTRHSAGAERSISRDGIAPGRASASSRLRPSRSAPQGSATPTLPSKVREAMVEVSGPESNPRGNLLSPDPLRAHPNRGAPQHARPAARRPRPRSAAGRSR